MVQRPRSADADAYRGDNAPFLVFRSNNSRDAGFFSRASARYPTGAITGPGASRLHFFVAACDVCNTLILEDTCFRSLWWSRDSWPGSNIPGHHEKIIRPDRGTRISVSGGYFWAQSNDVGRRRARIADHRTRCLLIVERCRSFAGATFHPGDTAHFYRSPF